ncbi:hypothetical protein F4Z99_17055 [Candidatus Poribacteria bacterium]|nr:hypothetical protein [Candidatus Poribacteria bacterium]MYB00920.1 hypothetical protein [Candidatus Poribacteria bacterium]
MKRISIVITLLFCIGGLIALWNANRTPSEVITIYKTVPYTPKSIRPTPVQNVQSPTSVPVAETERTADPDEREKKEVLLEDDAKLMPEADAFSEWLEQLDTELSEGPLSEERGEVAETDTATEIPYSELSRMVREAYTMESILNEYDIYVDELGKDVCPKCVTYNFHIARSQTGQDHDQWCCFECNPRGGDVIDFVSWMEGIDVTIAARDLAERAGLLK